MLAPVKLESAQEIVSSAVFDVKREIVETRLEFNDYDESNSKPCAKPDPEIQPPPPKRQRLVFDGVHLLTLAEVRQRQTEDEKSDFEKLALLKNTKVKKNVGMALLPQTLRDRLKPIGLEIQDQYFTLDQATREVVVTRHFISATYGGNMEETFPSPARKFLDVHGMDDWMFLPTEYQPEAPLLAGAPGLWFCINPDHHIQQTKRVFVKAVPEVGPKASVYQYMGMYKVAPATPLHLTVVEYATQSAKFRETWAKALPKKGWGLQICARILLRRELGREPTWEEVEHAQSDRKQQCKEVPTAEIKAAFMQGKEKMSIYTMKCVGYDNDFQRDLSEKFPVWVPPPPKTKKTPGNGNRAAGKTKAGNQKPRLKKRKREVAPESGPEGESDLGDKLEYVDPPAMRSQKRKCEATLEADPNNDSESDGGLELEYVDSHVSRFRKRTPDDGKMNIDQKSDDDIEYIDPPVSPSPRKFDATPDAVLDMGSESDEDELEYVDPPVASRSDEIINISDEEQKLVSYKLSDGTRVSPICLW